MSGSQFQLTPPFSTLGTGYQRRWFSFPQLTLDPQFAASQLGWSVMASNRQVYNLWPDSLGSPDDALQNAMGRLSNAMQNTRSSDPQLAVPAFLQSVGVTEWDQLYGLARQFGASTWADIPSNKANIVTGQPASGGKITPSGVAMPTSADGVIAGFGIPSPAISAGKRFPFSSGLDVHLYIYGDKDAYAQDTRHLITGGGIGFEGKTSDGTTLKLRVGAGRDQAGGGAGFIRLQIGPDFVAPPATP